MGKIWAVINLGPDETAQNLLSAFFSKNEFNSKNTILIEERTVFMEIFFEEISPQSIAEAIGGYREIQFGFGEVSNDLLKKGGRYLEQTLPENKGEDFSLNQRTEEDVGEDVPSAELEEEAGEDVPAAEPEEEASEDVSTTESAEVVGEDVPVTEPKEEEPVSSDEGKDASSGELQVSKRKKSRKAPEAITQIDEIARRCTTYKQFAGAVAKWLELGKRESYFVDLAETAANVEKIAWTPIEDELRRKGYNNPFSVRNTTSGKVTQKLAEKQIDCSFIALVEYVVKYKNFDFRANIEAQVKQILAEMGIEKEAPELQKEITNVAITSVMVESDRANIRDICIAAGYGLDEDAYWDAKMNFSKFVNDFLQEKGMEIMSANDFIGKLREAVYTGTSIW